MTVNVGGTIYSHSSLLYEGGAGILTAPKFKGDLTGNVTGNATSADKLTTGNKGTGINPIYLVNGVPIACNLLYSGNWFNGIPVVGGDGVMEVGRYIDFHLTYESTNDYDLRLIANSTGLTLPGTTVGNFSGDLSGNSKTTDKIKVTKRVSLALSTCQYLRIATVTFPSTGLSSASATLVITNRESLSNRAGMLFMSIRRNSILTASAFFCINNMCIVASPTVYLQSSV